MTISTHDYAATLLVGAGHALSPRGGRVTMDEGWSPHVQAELTIPIPAQTVQELIDPRQPRRVKISCAANYTPAQSRVFDLGLRDRQIDHEAGEMTLSLASDEALLQDDVWLATAPNTAALAYQSSLRSIINNVVLSRIGAALQPGAADSSFYVLTDSTNLFTNPTAQIDTTDTTSQGLTNLVRQTGVVPGSHGTGFRLNGAAATGDSAMMIGGDSGALRNGMQAGKTYTVSGIFMISAAMAGTAVAQARRIVAYTRVGSGSYVTTSSAQAPNAAGNTRLSVTFTVPPGATEAFVRFYHGHASTASCYWIDLRLSEGTETAYFDGDTADTADYGYNWTGAAGKSTATRTALVDRSPELLNWKPGESAWDFVQPLFQAAALRLFCDEARKWWLVDGSYIASGQTQLSTAKNLTKAVDQISRDDDDWFDAALFIYRWRDSTGAAQEAIDWYAEPGRSRVRTFILERAYPGPGAARYAVKRAAGRGRTLDVSAVSQYAVKPTQPVTVTLPATPIQTGVVASVAWDLATDEMAVKTRGLTDTPPTAWIFLPAGTSWLASPPGGSWLSETIGA
ncbi:hypothetical protein EV379_0913 [Microterricola gilva]|uniref:Tail protein n=1 Tax=Microterricola gilva TaxID=393267 RepID=A0A4Q8AJE3_9MICO|nr:hypothetical protein [Microterricola gilva]RZU64610.1 hypothetical protein EV379_0913 [Microterricola gilva]